MRVFRIENEKEFILCLSEDFKALYKLGVKSGLRISDLLRMTKKQLVKRPYIKQKKTGKTKRIYINNRLLKELRAVAKGNNIFVFENSKTGKPYSRQAVYKAFKKAGEKAGISTAIGTHSMRKKYAYNYMQKTEDISQVQSVLQHESVAETALYMLGGEYNTGKRKHHRKTKRSSSKSNTRSKTGR